MANPRLEPVVIGDLRIVDRRDVDEATSLLCHQKATEGNIRLLTQFDVGRSLPQCSSPGRERSAAIRDRYFEALESNPALTWEEFMAGGGGVFDDSDLDPRLPFMLFSVFMNGEPHGEFTVQNMVIESETDEKIEASAYAVYLSFPEFDTSAEISAHMLKEWGIVMRRFLDHDLYIQGGQILDIVEWRFPAGIPWRQPDDSTTAGIEDAVIPEIRRVGVLETTQPDAADMERVRRASAPREIDGATPIPRDPALDAEDPE